MASLAYLGLLLISEAGMITLDVRYRLFWAANWRRAAMVHVAMVVFFLVWDLAGIAAGVFFRGDGQWLTGILIAPELPLEEVVFLTFLTHLTMVLVLGLRKWRGRDR